MKTARAPVVTLLLVAANIAVAYALLWRPDFVLNYGFDPTKPSFLTAFTSLFLHQNVFHLLGNMVFLAALGPAVESAARWWRFLTVYVLGGLAAVLTHYLFTRHAPTPVVLIGASGSVAACIAYYNLRYVHLQVTIAPKKGVPILVVTLLWLAMQVLGAIITVGVVIGGQSYWAHLGGFGAGLLLALFFRAPKEADRLIGHAGIDKMHERGPAAKLAATDRHLAEHPEDASALQKKAETLAMLGDRDHEAEVLVQLLDQVDDHEQAKALARLIGIGQITRLPSLRRMKLAEKFRPTHPDLDRGLLLSVARDSSDRERPEALLALACGGDDSSLRELAEHYPLHPACDLARARGLL